MVGDVTQGLDEVEVRRVLAKPWPNMKGLRDALDIVVNGKSLSRLHGGAPFDVDEARSSFVANWSRQGRTLLLNCDCGTPECGGFEIEVEELSSAVRWKLLWSGEMIQFDKDQFETSVRDALA